MALTPSRLTKEIKSVLTPDLLKKEFRGGSHPLSGYCYISSEAAFHIMGGESSNYKPMFIKHEGLPHWFLRSTNGKILDITAKQFRTPVPYEKGIRKGFLTKNPSKRAVEVMRRITQL
jgi:hypothetical protein